MRFMRTFLAAALLGLFFGFAAHAADDDRKPIEKKPTATEPTTDKEFLNHALASEVAAVKFAERAEKAATGANVKKLAEMMGEDHKKLRDDFLQQAKKMKVIVVEGLEKAHRDQYDRLNRLEGSAYDREYVRFVADSHEKTIAIYKKWAKEAKDSDLREVATKALSKWEEHLAHIKKVKDSFEK